MIPAVEEKRLVEIEQQLQPSVSYAEELVIANPEALERAVETVRDFKLVRLMIENTFDQLIDTAHKQHKALLATKRTFTDPLDNAEKIIKGKAIDYVRATGEKAKGLTVKELPKLDASGVDMKALAKLVSSGKLPVGLLSLNTTVAKDLLAAGLDIPGVKSTTTYSAAIRG